MLDRFSSVFPGLLVLIGGVLLGLVIAADHIGIKASAGFGITQILAAMVFSAVVICGIVLRTTAGRRWLFAHRRSAAILSVWLVIFVSGSLLLQVGLQLAYRLSNGHWFWDLPCEVNLSKCPMYASDGTNSWRLGKNLRFSGSTDGHRWEIATNPSGFRGSDGEFDEPPDVFKLLVLGDSFTFGWGVNEGERYGSLLEAELRDVADTSIRVAMVGVPNWGINQELNYLKEEGLDLKPDLVVLQFYPFDWEVGRSRNRQAVGGYLIRTGGSGSASIGRLEIYLRNHIIGYSELRRLGLPSLFKKDADSQAMSPRTKSLDAFSSEPYPPTLQADVEEAMDALQRMHDTVESFGSKLAIMILPVVFKVEPDQVNKWVTPQRLTGDLDIDKPQRMLAELCTERKWNCLDLLPLFIDSRMRGPESLYFPVDAHLSPEGHKLTARLLAEWLVATGLAPSLLGQE